MLQWLAQVQSLKWRVEREKCVRASVARGLARRRIYRHKNTHEMASTCVGQMYRKDKSPTPTQSEEEGQIKAHCSTNYPTARLALASPAMEADHELIIRSKRDDLLHPSFPSLLLSFSLSFFPLSLTG